MSAESSGGPWPPQTDSAKSDSGPETADSENHQAKSLSELPNPAEKVREFLDEFGERAHVPLSASHGRELRPECFEESEREYSFRTDDGGEETRQELVERTARPVWQGVAEMLEWHEEYHRSTLRLEYGRESDPTHTLLDVDLENSWFAAYQDAERAKLKALERETCGFETCEECETRYCSEPDEHDTEHVAGRFEEPVVVLTGRTASGAGRPPVDHARAIADAWTSGGVRRNLRYTLEHEANLGLESDEWVRWSQGEPHPGDGQNRGYHHAHDVIILDGAAASEEVTAETFRPLIEKHVEECEPAGPAAHDLDTPAEQWAEGNVETVSVKHVEGEIEESVASYAATYLANEKVDLLEREPEYLFWAATMWATNTQKGIKSDSANYAIAADRCKHQHAEDEQELAHGEEITFRRVRGERVNVCLECGSPWGIEQTETLAEARREGPAVADGGAVPAEETVEQSAEEELRERWPSARAAARVGGETAERECQHEQSDQCPLCATVTESPEHTVSGDVPIPESATAEVEVVSVGFERPPQWRAKAIIREGEEIPATGGATEKKPLKLKSAPEVVVSMAARSAGVMKCLECGQVYDTIPEYLSHGCEGGRVGVGWLAPTEPVAEESAMSHEEFVERVPERYRPGVGGDQGDGQGDLDGTGESAEFQLGEEVTEYVRTRPAVTVAEVLGRFELPPDAEEAVAEVLETT